MGKSFEECAKEYLKQFEKLENLPDDNYIKKAWKSGEISDEQAIHSLNLAEYLEEKE